MPSKCLIACPPLFLMPSRAFREILNITAGECACAESVFTLVFCALAAGDDAAFEGGIPAASDGGLSGRTADMGVAVGCFCLIAVAAC